MNNSHHNNSVINILILLSLVLVSSCTYTDFFSSTNTPDLQDSYEYDLDYFQDEWEELSKIQIDIYKQNDLLATLRSDVNKSWSKCQDNTLCIEKYKLNPLYKDNASNSKAKSRIIVSFRQHTSELQDILTLVIQTESALREEIKYVQTIKADDFTSKSYEQIEILKKAIVDNIVKIVNTKQKIESLQTNLEIFETLETAVADSNKTNTQSLITVSDVFISGKKDEIEQIYDVYTDITNAPELIFLISPNSEQYYSMLEVLSETLKKKEKAYLFDSLILIIVLSEEEKKDNLNELQTLDLVSKLKAEANQHGVLTKNIVIRKVISDTVKNNAILVYTSNLN